ncbi:MAG TPA: ATP-binding protein [Flavihumibacter sp.]
MLKKIVIVGPESTGKSTICSELAQYYSQNYAAAWVPEYAREFLEKIGRPYTYEDLLTIAKGQLELEERIKEKLLAEASDGPALLFIDTNMIVMQVWSEYVFGKCDRFILDQVVKRSYDYYLLMNIDLPWTYDALREYPDLKNREQLYHLYYDILQRQSTPWSVISGNGEERRLAAIEAIDQLLRK